MDELTMIRPDDFHLHLRDGRAMKDALAHSVRHFARAIVMPNLIPPITTTQMATEYRQRILDALPEGASFEAMMTLYLTDTTPIDEICRAYDSGIVHGIKLYPAGATTNSDEGVTDLDRVIHVFEAMEECGLPLLVHGEVTTADVDPFDREKAFIDHLLTELVESFPKLKVVLEHVTTAEGVDFVLNAREGVAGTVTPHHLLFNRSALFAGGLRPHHYCLPVLKRERHRRALVEAVTGENSRLFLGTDSAPHPVSCKETDHCCAGIFNAHAALELCADIFESEGALERLEAFTSLNGAAFYGLEPNAESITIVHKPWTVPESYSFGDDRVVPLRARWEIGWQVL